GGHSPKAKITAAGRSPSSAATDEPQPGEPAQGSGPETSTTLVAPTPILHSGGGSGTGTNQTVVGTVVTTPRGTKPSTAPPRPTTTSPAGQPRTVTVTDADSGKSYTLHKGDRLAVQLDSSPYEWTEPVSSNDGVLHRTGGSSGANATGTFSATAQG